MGLVGTESSPNGFVSSEKGLLASCGSTANGLVVSSVTSSSKGLSASKGFTPISTASVKGLFPEI